MSTPSLRSLAEKKTDGIAKTTIFSINPKLVKTEKGFNLRAEGADLDTHIEQLFEVMKAGALLPPIDVQLDGEKVIVRDGHCRTAAAIKMLKVNPDYKLQCRQLLGNETDALIHMLGTGTGQRPLSILEAGQGYLRLINGGMKVAEIATRLGISRAAVDNGLTLAGASAAIQKAIQKGEVSNTTACDAVKLGKEGEKALLEKLKENREKPAKDKKGKAKKVTAKSLRGTKADKKANGKKKKTKAPAVAAPAETDDGTITIKISAESAESTLKFIQDSSDDSSELKEMVAALEMALL